MSRGEEAGLLRFFYSGVFVAFCVSLCGQAEAGYYYFPENRVVKACADGDTTAAAIFPGRGYFLLNINGNIENAYPMDVMNGGWSPVLGGTSLCWQRNLSWGSAQELIQNWNEYCVFKASHYCRYN